ncbi:hypothetical protein SASPL_120444 [Salvia splendens]|uniref:Exostosin GT47 domain-containing protein n=1 Tax=Salvia splendens TaxID=180675 RepID=A0A8X8ZVA0_SALSN|nr:hypothetical protein SASPL_120444 [Salvia splendens]
MQAHLISPSTPRSIFVYFRGLFYDVGNDPEGGYYARGARASVWENFKDNPLFDISTEHPTTYYEDMQRAIFCLCPLGWAPWSPRLVEAVVFGCIPVIIADDIVLPFADAIPWEDIGIFVAEKDVPKLDTILTSIPIEEILRKQRVLANPSMKQAMLFPHPAQARDAFHQILNGLARKLPHDRSIYLRSGESILNWTAGPTSVRNGHKSSWSQVHGATISAAGSYHRPLCAEITLLLSICSPIHSCHLNSQLSQLLRLNSRCVLLPSKPTSAAIAGISTMTEHLLRNWLITISALVYFYLSIYISMDVLVAVCGAPKRRFRPYAPDVSKNANSTDVRKARKEQIKRDEAIGYAGIALRNSTWSGSIDCPIFLPQHHHLRLIG